MAARNHHAAPGMMRHGPPSGAGRHDPPEVVAQVAEIDRLLSSNRRLAASIRVMRQDLGVSQDEIQRLQSHIRSTETESDIQVRVLLDKIGKMQLGIKAGESVKEDLQQAHKEAQSLVAARKELVLKIEEASQELETYHTDMRNVPEMISELDSMVAEHQRLRSAFDHEKRINLDLVERMQSMENNLVAMSREVKTLKAEVQNAENRAQAPNGFAYSNSDPQYPSRHEHNDPYYDPYRRALVQTPTGGAVERLTLPHNANSTPPPTISNPPVSSAVSSTPWGEPCDPKYAHE